jgi:glucose-1-phosphate thymidylyltransferase
MWSIAIWTARFTDYLHRFLESPALAPAAASGRGRELYIGDVVQAAIDDGLEVQTVVFADGSILDVGTPASLLQAERQLGLPTE